MFDFNLIQISIVKYLQNYLYFWIFVNLKFKFACVKLSLRFFRHPLYDKLVQDMEDGEDVVLLLLDQSKAYDLVPHKILIKKMEALNFSPKILEVIGSYLRDCKQYVQIVHCESEIHLVGTRSVTQGSTLSCLFYLIFILDIPQICHEVQHSPLEQTVSNADT